MNIEQFYSQFNGLDREIERLDTVLIQEKGKFV